MALTLLSPSVHCTVGCELSTGRQGGSICVCSASTMIKSVVAICIGYVFRRPSCCDVFMALANGFFLFFCFLFCFFMPVWLVLVLGLYRKIYRTTLQFRFHSQCQYIHSANK